MRSTKVILIGLVTTVLAATSCNNGPRRDTGKIYMPDMAYSRAYETYSSTKNLSDAGISYNAILFPNPVGQFEKINLRFNAFYTGVAELSIYNILGQKVMFQSIAFTNGINTVPINVMNLTKGSYYIDLISDKGERMVIGKRFVTL